MRILVPPGVFRPRSDSWQLAAAAAAATRPGFSVLDLCTGSGVVATAMAIAGARNVVAVDSARLATWTARGNGLLNGHKVYGRHGDLFAAVVSERFDLITANPPYLPWTGADRSRPLARAINGGADGREVLDRIIAEAPDHLRPGGMLMLIHSSVCGVEITEERLRHAGLQPAVRLRERGPLGPLLTRRRPQLVDAGLIAPDSDEEEMVIVTGSAS